MASLQMTRESQEEEWCPRSPEAKLGMKVEDLWDVQEPQLSPTEKFNACFESIPVSSFPPAPKNQVIEIRSDASLAEAVKILAKHKVLSAPVVDVNAPEDASWMDRYTGIVEFAGIVMWILQQTEPASPSSPSSGSALARATSGISKAALLEILCPGDAPEISGSFFETLTSSELYKCTTVQDIAGSFRWAPFLALQKSNSFLTMLLLLSKYKMKSIPVVDLGECKIDNVITQSAVIHMLSECVGLPWFENWGNKKLSEIGLPLMSSDQIVKVGEDEPVLQAFKTMRKKRIGGIPVVESGSSRAIGNISIRDIYFLLAAPEMYHDYRSITTQNFLTVIREYQKKNQETSAILTGMVTCTKDNNLKELINKLDSHQIQRMYVVDDAGNLEGVITLRDIISRLVHEPPGYFGDFFDGVLPLPVDSRV